MNKDNLKTKIYNEVLSSVIKGEYPPEGIISESMLIERFKVSKSPVREALIQLCNEGVLKSMPRFGYVVVKLTNEDIKDILIYRMAMEGGMLRYGMEKIRSEDIMELEEIDRLCTSDEAKKDFWVHWEHNMEFHRKLISCAHNQFAYDNLENSLKTLTRAYGQFYWNKWNNMTFPSDTRYHAKIIEAIKEGNWEEALKWLEEDIKDFGL